MKSLRFSSLLAALLLVVVSCGGDASTATTTNVATSSASNTTVGTTAAAGSEGGLKVALVLVGEINDLSWNQQMYEGALALQEEGVISELGYTELVPEGDSERAIRGYAEDGFELIVAHAFGYGDTVKAVAADFPDTAFAWPGGIAGQAGNVADYDQPFYEATYLLGIIAGDVSETGILGGAGGFDIPVCHSMIEAFYLGAQEVNPDARGLTTYVGDWGDVALAKEAAAAAAAEGADVFAACGEGPVLGQIELAKEQDLVATGYVGDMHSLAPDNLIASIVWNIKELLRTMINDIQAGSFTPAKYYSVGVAEDGILVVVNPDMEDRISPDALALVEERIQGIKDGSFEVPFIPQ